MFCGLLFLGAAQTSLAQTSAADTRIEQPEQIRETALKQARARIEDNTQLSEDKQNSALAFYDTALSALNSAQGYVGDVARLKTVFEGATARMATLDAQVSALQDAPPADIEAELQKMDTQTLSDFQQSLITKEARLRALRTRITDLTQDIETLQQRRQLAPTEQTEALERIAALSEQVTSMGDGELEPVEQAEKVSLQAQLYMRRNQVVALEQEIVSFTERQSIMTANRTIAQLEQQRLGEEVTELQRLTGQQRLTEVKRIRILTEGDLDALENPHPLVLAYAQTNVDLAADLSEIAAKASKLPLLTAQSLTRVDIIDADLRTATSLIELGNLSRQSATTLRKLRTDTPSAAAIRADIKIVNQDIAIATQGRLLSQDNLRDFLLGGFNVETIEDNWRSNNIGAELLEETGNIILPKLSTQRRNLLTAISAASSDHLDALTRLKIVQESLLESTDELTEQLDRNLLWLPSTAPISLSWPKTVLAGTADTFSAAHIQTAIDTIVHCAKRNSALVIFFLLLIVILYMMRKSLWEDIERRASFVGRVQKDTYFHTPAVLIACVIIAMPLALLFLLLSILLSISGSPDNFIISLSDTFSYLAVFTGFFLTWRAWDSDLSLFDKHFKLPKGLRDLINRHLVWFIPLVGTSTALLALTDNSPNPSINGGLGLAAFIVTCVLLSSFFYLVTWKHRHETNQALSGESRLQSYRTPLAFVGCVLPPCAAIFASLGYFETARELMYRIFIAGGLLVGAYVVHGVIRRSMMIGKRRLSLSHAIERRDKAVKLREDKAAAEERGETMPQPAPIDYEGIDVESMSRQTMQLIDVIMFIAFAAFMWMIWSDLLPALTFFNGFELSSYTVEALDAETGVMTRVERVITLWNVMQAVVIAALTALAARNLPSFLEIFVLNRVGIDAGTRYAIVTILGYIIIAFGVFFTLDRLGLQWSELKFVVAGLSVGIGLGLQKIIANFVSGLIILFERPVRLGDYVTIGDQSGTVSRIKIRATTLVDLDLLEILIPNEALISERVTNWTLSSSITRLIVPVGIAYGSDTDHAAEVMLAELKAMTIVLETPEPKVLFTGFGDSSLDFELHVFLRSFEDRVPTQHLIHMQINKALAREGITIPFPQRDLHFITQPNLNPVKAKKPATKAKAPKTKPKTTGIDEPGLKKGSSPW